MSEFLKAIAVLVHSVSTTSFLTRSRNRDNIIVVPFAIRSHFQRFKRKGKKKEEEKKKEREREGKAAAFEDRRYTRVCNLTSRAVGALIDRQMFSTAGNLETDV